MSTRLALIRDYSIVSAQTEYETIKGALDDLDFIMSVYDDEENYATFRCDDVLVNAIRKARADASSSILAANITLPGIAEVETDGMWPSLVVSHKYYRDGRRYQTVENYNPQMSPFWMGRSVMTPARTRQVV
jgi:hypothetical protein